MVSGVGDAHDLLPANEYRTVLDRVPAVVYIADPGETGRWHYVSPQITAMLGFSPYAWRRDPSLWRERLHPDDRAAILQIESGHALSAHALEPNGSELRAVEYRMIHRDGHVVWIRDDARLVAEPTGARRWHGVLSDITARKLADAELECRAAQQAAVARLGEHALQRVGISELIQEAVESAADVLDADCALVGELLPGNEFFQMRAVTGWPASELGDTSVRTGTRSQAGYTLLTRNPVTVCDWSAERRFDQSQPLVDHGVRSGITVMIDGAPEPFGIFGVHFNRLREHSAGDIDYVQSLANVLADALARQSVEDAIAHHALHDALTGLPNRVLFNDRLQLALNRLPRAGGSLLAVLFIDLDQFKLVNDSLGHHAGDELLAAVAARLSQTVRPGDTIARFGGDEFGLLVEALDSERDAVATAERIAAVFARPFLLGDSEQFVSASIGIAMAAGGELPSELIRDADSAMYRAKDRGRARYELFDERMRARAIARLRVENDLRRALERRELRLEYQPVVQLPGERITGLEALIRWDHPERGLVGPEEFVPVAEENGLIDRIGRWVLDTACRQAAAWARLLDEPVGIAVNLSPQQLHHRDFPAIVARTLQATGLDPRLLRFEITEALLLDESSGAGETLRALKALGARLVLDDFGTGYSSLGYLTRLPLDALKIDRSFVQSLGGRGSQTAITEAIVGMAQALSLGVVGEGVETRAQADELQRLGAHYAQGFLFSEALPAEGITELLIADSRTPVHAA